MNTILLIVQILLSVALVGVILMQSQGSGMGSSFGGGGEFYRSKRGLEKVLLKVTVIIAVLFLLSSLANILIR